MTPLSLIREKPVNPHSRSGNPQTRIPAASVSVSVAIITRAELAQCTCPEHCERDHEND